MSKQILPAELAELVCGLLLNPNILGELDSKERHQAFMLDIGRVIADHCGGHVNGINGPDWEEGYLQEEQSSPMLSVSPNDSLPSINKCIWSYFDPDGWEDEEIEGIETEEPFSAVEVAKVRSQLQCLLSNYGLANNSSHNLSFPMVDWRIPEGSELEDPADNRKYLVNATMGNQSSLEFFDERGEPCFGLMIEINHGVPKIQVSANGQDITLQIHAAHGGLVLTPEELGAEFESAAVDRFSYNDPSSLLIRHG